MTKIEARPAMIDVKELFSKSPDGLREIVRAVMQEVLEAEMTDALGAEKGERTAARLGYRSSYFTRTLVTRVGKLELRVRRIATADIGRSAYEHREGLVKGFTKRYGLKRLVYMDFHERIIDASQRESNIKHWPCAWKARLILDANPGWLDLFETLNQ